MLKRKHHNRIQQTDKRIFLKTAKAKQNQIHTQEALVKSQNHLEFPTGPPAKPATIKEKKNPELLRFFSQLGQSLIWAAIVSIREIE